MVVLAPLNVPPFSVTMPVKSLVPVLLVKERVPLVIVVVPVVVKAKAPVVRVPPETVRLPLTVSAAPSVHVAVPPIVRLPSMGDVMEVQVLALVPANCKW